MTRLAILDDYQKVALQMADWKSLGPAVTVEVFHDTLTDQDALAERLGGFEIIVAMRERTPFRSALLERLGKLKLLVTTGVRNASIDLKAAAERGIMVCGTEVVSSSTVELTWGLILAARPPHFARGSGHAQRALANHRGHWLGRQVLGLLGLGNLGSRVAVIGKAFQMRMVAWSENLTAEHAASLGVERVEKEELFRRADFLSIHMVLSKRSRGLVDAPELAVMKPTAWSD